MGFLDDGSDCAFPDPALSRRSRGERLGQFLGGLIGVLAIAAIAAAVASAAPHHHQSRHVKIGLSPELYRRVNTAVTSAALAPGGKSVVITLSRKEAEDFVIQIAQGMTPPPHFDRDKERQEQLRGQ